MAMAEVDSTSLSPWRSRVNMTQIHVGFVADEVAAKQVFVHKSMSILAIMNIFNPYPVNVENTVSS